MTCQYHTMIGNFKCFLNIYNCLKCLIKIWYHHLLCNINPSVLLQMYIFSYRLLNMDNGGFEKFVINSAKKGFNVFYVCNEGDITTACLFCKSYLYYGLEPPGCA